MKRKPAFAFFTALAWIVLGLLLSLSGAEIVARFLPVTKGLYRTQNSTLWPLHGYGPHLKYSYSLTWQMLFSNRGQTNNYGHIAPYDYARGAKPIAVIGDSFVESQMNRYEQTVQGRLNDLFSGHLPVYGFGFAGNSIAEYLAIARMVKAEFAPTTLVFLVIDNDVKESWQRRIGHRYFAITEGRITEEYWPLERGSVAQRIRHTIGDSALYRYVQVNLAFTPSVVLEKHFPSPLPVRKASDEAVEVRSRLAIDYFLQNLAKEAGLPAERIFLVFDSDRERIYDPEHPPRQGVDSSAVQTYFQEHARRLGYDVIDTSDIFSQHYAEHRRRFDFSPTDRHWNTLGHGVVAEVLFRRLGSVLCGIDERLGPGICSAALDDSKTDQHLGKNNANE